MVLELPTSSPRPTALRSRGVRTLRELPPRRPQQPAPLDAVVRWVRTGDRYEVRVREHLVGYIDVVGAVFVVLAGARYDRAVEVLQTLDFDAAVRAISSAEG
ncbi:hypothetical protein [Microbacterium gallinarum]|uniref:hypothetical protein n=1 Tax=Microbacterium gallinarum TaxID=2762209 RepID=UPI001CD8D056|nr:hypothetical protein [Microbacterium gallinarum]